MAGSYDAARDRMLDEVQDGAKGTWSFARVCLAHILAMQAARACIVPERLSVED
jgi:hypothetical protein